MSRAPKIAGDALDSFAAYEEQLDRMESDDGELKDGEAYRYTNNSEMGDLDGLGTFLDT